MACLAEFMHIHGIIIRREEYFRVTGMWVMAGYTVKLSSGVKWIWEFSDRMSAVS